MRKSLFILLIMISGPANAQYYVDQRYSNTTPHYVPAPQFDPPPWVNGFVGAGARRATYGYVQPYIGALAKTYRGSTPWFALMPDTVYAPGPDVYGQPCFDCE